MTQIAVRGNIFNYQTLGEGNNSPLLILHGWGRSSQEWVGIALELSKWSGRKVYVLDLPGFGGSSIPRVNSIFEYTQLVVDFCKYIELKQVIVIGHSLGGRVGIVMAAKFYDLVEKLILIDPAGVKPRSLRRVLLRFVSTIFVWLPPQLKRTLGSRLMDEDYTNSSTTRDLYRAIVKDDLKSELCNIKCKTAIIWGENDPLLPLALAKTYLKLIPNSRLRVVWGALHNPHQDKPEQTLKILQECVE